MLLEMADPLSFGISLLTILDASIKSARSLCELVKRYKGRDKTLNKLFDELEDLSIILSSLEAALGSGAEILQLLNGPVERCKQLCDDLEKAIKKFHGKSKLNLIDWAKMEWMGSDINGFIDNLASYKATISIALGTITMQTSRMNHDLLERYEEMIKDTEYNLSIHLQRINESLAAMDTSTQTTLDTISLEDEKTATEQCLQICENAKSYINTLRSVRPQDDDQAFPDSEFLQKKFDAQLLTAQVLDENHEKLIQTIKVLQSRLAGLVDNNEPNYRDERSRLEEDVNISKQCLQVCEQASKQVSHQKIHLVGEVVADDDTDQVIVTTLADLFNVKKVLAKNRSAQLVGSMSEDALKQLSKDRYSSRFGTATVNLGPGKSRKENVSDKSTDKPTSNEMKKRFNGQQ